MAIELGSARPTAAPRGAAPRVAPRWPGGKRTPRLPGSAAHRRQFTEQLALLLDTGMALLPALENIEAQARDPAFAAVLGGLAAEIRQGRTFADALATQPHLFPRTYVTLVAAAEQGGYLQRVLRHQVTVEEKRAELVAMLKSAFSYPVFLVTFSLVVMVFVLTVVFPRFAELFAGIAGELPVTTRALMWLSDVLAGHLFWLAPALVILAGVGMAWLRGPDGTRAPHDWASRVPSLRGIMVRVYLVQMLRTLGLSLGNGVTLPEALEACSEIAPTQEFQSFVARLVASVREGQGAAAVFRTAELLPPLARQMLETGEESGELGLVSTRLADHYQLELERMLATLGRLLEPLLLLVMGVLVGVIVASLILPVFKLAHAVH